MKPPNTKDRPVNNIDDKLDDINFRKSPESQTSNEGTTEGGRGMNTAGNEA